MKRYNVHFTFPHSFITATIVSEGELDAEEIVRQAAETIELDGFDVSNAQDIEHYEIED